MESSETPTPPTGNPRISSDQIRRATFPQVLRGYDRDAVHDMLDRVADWMEDKADVVAGATPAVREELARVGERTAGILTAAEEAAANLRDEAQHYAVKIRADADDESRKARLNASQKMDELVAEAETKAQRIIDEAVARRRQLNQAISSLIERRDEIASEASKLADELMEAVEALRTTDPRDDPAGSEPVTPAPLARESQPEEITPSRPEAVEVETVEPESDEVEVGEPESDEQALGEPDSEEVTVFFEPETGSEEMDVLDDESEETELHESETGEEERREPPTLLVDPDAEDDTPPRGLPR